MSRFRKKEKLWQKKWGADEKKACAVICGGFLFLLLSAFLGEWKRENKLEDTFQTEIVWQSEQEEVMLLSKDHQRFLIELEEKMGRETIHQAAGQLEEEWEGLEEIFAEMPAESILYIEKGNLADSLEGMGLAIREDKTCFYGNFQKGKPEGICTAISYKRGFGYQYSMGVWKDGQMEGLGITGNVYLDGQTSSADRNIAEDQISGIFFEDKLDGSFTYQQIDGKGVDRWWAMTAQNGRTCLDKRWRFKEEIEEYSLLSEKEEGAIFVIPKNEMYKVWWENRVPWEEIP